jgi:hypothetical protein
MNRMVSLAAALALLGLACFNEEESPPAPKQFEPSSPVNVLKNVEISFNRRDINLLKAMLSTDFVFYFDPRDVGQYPPGSQYVIPEFWTRAEFLRAAANMFKKAHTIQLSISTGSVGEPRPEETEYYVENVPAELLVMINELDGFIAESASTFEFERYLAEGGGKYWRLTEWRDGGRYYDEAPAAGRPSTIGRVLALFYVI